MTHIKNFTAEKIPRTLHQLRENNQKPIKLNEANITVGPHIYQPENIIIIIHP